VSAPVPSLTTARCVALPVGRLALKAPPRSYNTSIVVVGEEGGAEDCDFALHSDAPTAW
jgi:hypothetical protein